KNMNFAVLIALPDNAPAALLQGARTPRAVEVVKSNQLRLHVRARPHLERRSEQYPNLSAAYFGEQFLLLALGIGVVNIGDFLGRNTFLHQFAPQLVVDVEGAILFGDG